MSNAEQKKKERVAMISHNIRVDNYKKEQLQLQKLQVMDTVLNPPLNQKKKSDFDSNTSAENAYRPNSSRAYPSGSDGDRKLLKKVQSARQIEFKSLNRASGGFDMGSDTGELMGLVESHLI